MTQFCFSLSLGGMSFAVIQHWFRSFKMLTSDPGTICSMLATLHVVTILVFRMDTFTQSTFSTILLTSGHPTHLACSTQVTWLWYSENYSELILFFYCLLLLESYFHDIESFCCIFLIFKMKFFAHMLFQVCPFLGVPKWEWTVHTCT